MLLYQILVILYTVNLLECQHILSPLQRDMTYKFTKVTGYDPLKASVHTISSTQSQSVQAGLIDCTAACAKSSLDHLTYSKSSKECTCFSGSIFMDDYNPSAHSDEVLFSKSVLNVLKRLLLVSQRKGSYFGTCVPDCDVTNSSSSTYSIASDTENHRLENGKFIFDLCYGIAVGDKCFRFKQGNNPFTTTTRVDFELLYNPVGYDTTFVGLASDSSIHCLSDGNLGGKWSFAVGTYVEWTPGFEIPGVVSSDETIVIGGQHVQLYVWTL